MERNGEKQNIKSYFLIRLQIWMALLLYVPMQPMSVGHDKCKLTQTYEEFPIHAICDGKITENYQCVIKTRGPRGHCRLPENNERIKKLTSEWNKK